MTACTTRSPFATLATSGARSDASMDMSSRAGRYGLIASRPVQTFGLSRVTIPRAAALSSRPLNRYSNAGNAPERAYAAAASFDVNTRTMAAAASACAVPFNTATVNTVCT